MRDDRRLSRVWDPVGCQTQQRTQRIGMDKTELCVREQESRSREWIVKAIKSHGVRAAATSGQKLSVTGERLANVAHATPSLVRPRSLHLDQQHASYSILGPSLAWHPYSPSASPSSDKTREATRGALDLHCDLYSSKERINRICRRV